MKHPTSEGAPRSMSTAMSYEGLICAPLYLTHPPPLSTHIPQPQQTPNTAVHVTPSEVNIVNVVYSWTPNLEHCT